ncbi:S41 family peptidase [Massilia sp. GCM10023247]|uniref:S41 family peptidase n=1 Tax=Massilia sp. GCM10023247 TaxID=3252643 RepID=UPI00361B4EB8
MKKKWIVIPSLLVLTALAAVAIMPVHFWHQFKPKPEVVVDHAMRVKVVDTLVAQLNDHYIFPDKAKDIEAVLHRRRQEGSYDGIKDGRKLAQQLSADLRGVAKDLHMNVYFQPGLVLPHETDGPPPESQAEWEQRTNFLLRLVMRHMASRRVEKVDHLGQNIGYLKVSGFPPPFLVADKYAAAMNKLADTDGLIVDLRENGGGSPQSVALLISYFVDQRTRLNDIWERKTGTTIQHWTQDTLDGKRYGGKKPVLILVGPDTMSAGEDFAYTMQALKRATVIGAPTWGGAHPARPHRIGEHFFAVIPGRRTISPITGSNWEGTGVTPDIAATPDSALAVAQDLLQRKLDRSAPLVAAGR